MEELRMNDDRMSDPTLKDIQWLLNIIGRIDEDLWLFGRETFTQTIQDWEIA